MGETIRNLCLAVALGLLSWVGLGVEDLKISVAVMKLQIAHLEQQNMKDKQYVQLTN